MTLLFSFLSFSAGFLFQIISINHFVSILAPHSLPFLSFLLSTLWVMGLSTREFGLCLCFVICFYIVIICSFEGRAGQGRAGMPKGMDRWMDMLG